MNLLLLSLFEISEKPFNFTVKTALLIAAFFILLLASASDIRSQTVPDVFPLLLLIIGVASAFWVDAPALSSRLLGLLIVSVPLLLFSIVTHGFGGADIKLFAVCGFMLGAKNIVFSFFVAIVCAAVFGIAYIVIRKLSLKTRIPFVPFISAGVIVAALFGDRLIAFYMAFIGL